MHLEAVNGVDINRIAVVRSQRFLKSLPEKLDLQRGSDIISSGINITVICKSST